MSRCYKVEVTVKGLDTDQLSNIMDNSWDGTAYQLDNTYIQFKGIGQLSGGCSEMEAHKKIENDCKDVNPDCKVETRWLCTEYEWDGAETYGSLE